MLGPYMDGRAVVVGRSICTRCSECESNPKMNTPALQFQSGGTLRPESLYVERPADTELPEALRRGEFCYVLAPRQIGKSSLRIRTAQKLETAGIRCASIDLTSIGTSQLSPEQWYFGL